MNQFLKGIITGGLIVIMFFITTAQIRLKLSDDDKKYYTEKGWVQSFFDLEINIGDRIDSLSRLLILEVNDIEEDIRALNARLEKLENIKN